VKKGKSLARQQSCPLLPSILVSVLAPKGAEKELTETFEILYTTWAVPKYGRFARLWAWGQVLKTAVVLGTQLALEVLERVNRRAR
jgi:hypothetical protein